MEPAPHGLDTVPSRLEQLLLTYGSDYEDVRHESTTAEVNEFFDPVPFQERSFGMRQEFDYEGLEGLAAVLIVRTGTGAS